MENAITSATNNHSIASKKQILCAPAAMVDRVCDEILEVIKNKSSTILLTGEVGRGKSNLLRKLGNKAKISQRLIFFNGYDFLTEASATINKRFKSTKNQNQNAQDFNFVKDFIYESLNLDENILIIVDSADFLPADILDDLIKITTQVTSKNYSVNLILAGLTKLKNQLDDVEKNYHKNLIHFSLDYFNEQDIKALASVKTFYNKPKNGELNFNKNALSEISQYVDGNEQLLDVILEWCSTLVDEKKASTVTKDIVSKAIVSAEELAVDKSANAEKAYPPSYDIEIDTSDEIPEIPLLEEDVSPITSMAFINDSERQTPHQKDTLIVNDALEIASNDIRDIEEEIMPVNWVSSPKKVSASKKPFVSLVAIIVTLIGGLAFLISYRIQPDLLINDDVEINTIEMVQEDAASQNMVPDNNPIDGTLDNEEIHLQEDSEVVLVDNSYRTDDETIHTINYNNDVSSAPTTKIEPVKQKDNSELIGTGANQLKNEQTADKNGNEAIDKKVNDEALIVQAPIQLNSNEPNHEINVPVVMLNTPITAEHELTDSARQQETNNFSESQKIENVENSLSETHINRLLATAEQQLAVKHLTTPYEDSAYKSYKAILESKPDHDAAKKGIQRIHAIYTNWANYYLRNNEIERSKHFFTKAIEIYPNDTVSQRMLNNISTQTPQTSSSSNIDVRNLSQAEIHQVERVYVGDLLIRAKLQLQNKNLTSPPHNNAYETYKKVLRYQPDNPLALTGISSTKQSYVNWAEQDLKDSNYRRATFFYEKALAIDPADVQLAQRLDKVKQLRNSDSRN